MAELSKRLKGKNLASLILYHNLRVIICPVIDLSIVKLIVILTFQKGQKKSLSLQSLNYSLNSLFKRQTDHLKFQRNPYNANLS